MQWRIDKEIDLSVHRGEYFTQYKPGGGIAEVDGQIHGEVEGRWID